MTFPYDQARLQALIDDVDARTTAAVQVAQQAAQYQPRSRGVSEQDLAAIERYARGGNAPKEFKDLQQRIDSGEFSWKDIAAGRVMDEGVQKALATGVPDLQRAYTAIQEGQDIEDVIASGNPEAQRPPRQDDDDEDDGPSHFRQDAW
ncbi:hypothetical protein [Lentzea aerocolonigenes]|uniref:hypothetical protein n=1 Tax=Lentzea aerocolonigenes TaxID=68170 RepID=UPI0004C32495|nr:hypothetical protein [Lentzea aerocolonigenes]MCP2249952.1 hypothetical protein [Lentzea aerocolonigenes]